MKYPIQDIVVRCPSLAYLTRRLGVQTLTLSDLTARRRGGGSSYSYELHLVRRTTGYGREGSTLAHRRHLFTDRTRTSFATSAGAQLPLSTASSSLPNSPANPRSHPSTTPKRCTISSSPYSSSSTEASSTSAREATPALLHSFKLPFSISPTHASNYWTFTRRGSLKRKSTSPRSPSGGFR